MKGPPEASLGIAGKAGDWNAACHALSFQPPLDAAAARQFFETYFIPFAAGGPDGSEGLFTGYYEAELHGSHHKTAKYRYPLLGRPQGQAADPGPTGSLSRAEIEAGKLGDKAPTLLWVDDAVEFFAAHRAVRHCVQLLADVGLGYLSLGQPSPTLSGGESQRIKLVTELAKSRTDAVGLDIARREGQHTLYVLDEPTVGLHMADVEKLVQVLQRLVDAGNSVVVIEHNLDVMAEADWIIDLGPDGGSNGGRVVAEGDPDGITRKPGGSHTAQFLRAFLQERGVR